MPIEQVSPELERIVSPGPECGGAGHRLRWRGRAVVVGGRQQPVIQRSPGQPQEEVVCRRRRHPGSGAYQQRQRPYPRPQGRLVMCEGGARRVSRVELDGSTTVIANNYHGRPLNRPNDVVVKSDGSIYFTDPGGPSPDTDLDFAGVYRVSPDLGSINLLVRDYVLPNGLCFSPDESILYINDSQGLLVRDDTFRSIGHIDAFDVRANGVLANRRVFCELRGEGDRHSRRHESGRRRKRLLHRTWRSMGHGRHRQASGNNSDRGGAYHQHSVGRRRLEDYVHHHPGDPGAHPTEDSRYAGPGLGETFITGAGSARSRGER